MRHPVWTIIVLIASGCASPSVIPEPDGQPPSVAGDWYLDQPMHALYEATIYRFHDDGRVAAMDAYPENYRTGTVGTRDLSISCEFTGPWESDGDFRLSIGVACSDGHAREVLLHFEEGLDVCGGDHGCQPRVHSVDGDTEGWTRNWPEWMWTRCADEEDCLTRLRHWTGR